MSCGRGNAYPGQSAMDNHEDDFKRKMNLCFLYSPNAASCPYTIENLWKLFAVAIIFFGLACTLPQGGINDDGWLLKNIPF